MVNKFCKKKALRLTHLQFPSLWLDSNSFKFQYLFCAWIQTTMPVAKSPNFRYKSSSLIMVHVSWEAEVELKVETDVCSHKKSENRIDCYRSETRSKLLKRRLVSMGRYHTCTKSWGKPFTKRQNGSQNPNDDK